MGNLPTLAGLKQRSLAGQGVILPSSPEEPASSAAEQDAATTAETTFDSDANNLRTSAQTNNETSAHVPMRTRPDVHKTESALVHNETRAQTPDAAEGETAPDEGDALLAEILAMSKTPLVHNSARAPEDLVAVLEKHLGDNWKKGIKKQALMIRAVMLLAHEIKTGKPLVVFGNEKEAGLGE